MGSFYADLAKAATEGIEKVGAKVASKVSQSPRFGSLAPKITQFAGEFSDGIERGLYHGILGGEKSFDIHPAARLIGDVYNGPYKETLNKTISEMTSKAKVSGSTIQAADIERAAKKHASDYAFGQDRSRIQTALKIIEKTGSRNKAEIFADNLNVLFKEESMDKGKKAGLSQFDVDMRKSGKGEEEKGFETLPSKYKSPNLGEQIAGGFKRTLAWKAAFPHAVTNLNILSSDGLKVYAKTLADSFGSSRKGTEAQLLASNAISEMWMAPYREHQEFKAGLISKYAPGSVGEFIHKNMYIPGLSDVRYQHLIMGAQAGYHVAQEAAGHLANGDMKWALPALKELGLDAQKIKSQGFKLAPDDIEKAYYHGADHRVFLDNNKQTPLLWRRSPMFRTMHAFTGYITNQWAFERATMVRQWQQGDGIGIARNLALKATVYPIVGATIYEMEHLLTGQDWDDPLGHLKNRVEATPLGAAYDALAGKEKTASSAKIALNTIDMLSHLGTWGTATGYIRGAERAKLAQQIGGPLAGVSAQLAEDALKATKTDNRHPQAASPFKRDLLSDIPSYGLGGQLAKKFYPTRADTNKKKIKKVRISRKLKPESNNPLNANDAPY